MASRASSLMTYINEISFFDRFSQVEKGKLLEKVAMFKKYDKKGSIIFSEGDKSASMFVTLEGVVGITRLSFDHNKKEHITLAKLEKGSVFGEISLLTEQNRTTSAITRSPLVIVMVIDKKTLESFDLSIQKIFQTEMISTLINRLDEMNKKYRNLLSSNI
jgi:CRP-like cAMP-binding protein